MLDRPMTPVNDMEKEETVKQILENIDGIQRETIAQLVMITDALVDGFHPVGIKDPNDNEPSQSPTILDELRIKRDNAEAILKSVVRIRSCLW